MCLNWSYLKNNSRRQCTDTPLDPQLCRSLNWQHREPIESSYDPSEALLKIPARGSRAPADGGFPLVRETQRERERESKRSASGRALSEAALGEDFFHWADLSSHWRTKRTVKRAKTHPTEPLKDPKRRGRGNEGAWVLSVCGGGDNEENYRRRR